jgi:6-phosphogluconolactonase (cycloisomerase 2 family)
VAVDVINDTLQPGFVYVASHDSNSVAAFSFDNVTGKLTRVPGSPFPVDPHPTSLAMGCWDLHLFVT